MSERMNGTNEANNVCEVTKADKIAKNNMTKKVRKTNTVKKTNGVKKVEVVWKKIEGFSAYEISNTGIVRNSKTEHPMKPTISNKKYVVHIISNANKTRGVAVHILVAKAFFKLTHEHYKILHKNGNKLDNRVENLKVKVTRSFDGKVNGDFSERVNEIKFEEGEEFKYITNFENYIITSNGRVFNLRYKKPRLVNGCAYNYAQRVTLSKGHKTVVMNIHVLVMTHFNPKDPKDDWYIVHKNKDVYDNRLSNLEWAKVEPVQPTVTIESLTKPGEIWKDVSDYPDNKVSNLGRVLNTSTMYVLQSNPDKDDGYVYVTLYNKSGRKTFKAHILIANAFLQKPSYKVTVNHKNGIKHDNCLENLEWATPSQQAKHARKIGLIPSTITGNPVAKYKDDQKVKEYKSIKDAARDTGISDVRIRDAIKGIRNHTGFTWKLINVPREEEIWKPVTIKGYEHYMVSNQGRIKNDKGKIHTGTRMRGYRMTTLTRNKEQKHVLIHVVVALAFIKNPKPDEYDEVNHKDKNRSNNFVDNLEWCDHPTNGRHSSNPHNYKTGPIGQYDANGNLVKKWDKSTDASKSLKIRHCSIMKACKGKQKTAGGFVWKYIDSDN